MMVSSWLRRRLRALFTRPTVEREMADELALHFELEVERLQQTGLSHEDARRRALHLFGGLEPVKESYRDARGVRPIETVAQDLRHAVRTLGGARGFTAAMVLTLGIGIGATAAIFSVVNGVLLRSLPFRDAHRVVMVWETDRDSGTDDEPASVPDYLDFVARSTDFDALAAFMPLNPTWIAPEPMRLDAAAVTANLGRALGVVPQLGRDLLPEDDLPGAPRVVVLSDRFWRTRFGADPRVLGRSITLTDGPATVVGVLPRGVAFPRPETDLWVPLRLTPESVPRSRHFITMVGRLRTSVTVDRAQRGMSAIAADLERLHPRDNTARGVRLETITETLVGGVRRPLLVLMSASALVLIIACANAAGLLLARSTARAHEVAVRVALGATRARLVQQFVVENLVLTAAAATLGLALAVTGTRVLVALAPATLPRREEIGLDSTVVVVAMTVAALIALAFGVLAAARDRIRLETSLRDRGTRGGSSRRDTARAQRSLIVGQVALSMTLAVTAGLLIRSFEHVRRVDPGFDAERLVRLRYQLPAAAYPQDYADFPAGWSRIIGFQRDVQERVSTVPGVVSVAIGANDPMSAGFTNSFVIEGREAEAAAGQPELATRPVSASYFATVGVPLLAGRGFTVGDAATAPAVLIVNQAAADRFFPNQTPLGRRLRMWGASREIVGVVGNERFAGPTAEAPPAMYPPIAQAPMPTASLLVRTSADPAAVLPGILEAVRSVDSRIAPFDVGTMDDAVTGAIAGQRFAATLVGTFAILAVLLAAIGLYGLLAYMVVQRRREIGIRAALGAARSTIVGAIVGDGLRLAVIGAGIGAAGGVAAGRALAGQLYGVAWIDPASIGVAAAVLVSAALVASYAPARRAAGVDPLVALREE